MTYRGYRIEPLGTFPMHKIMPPGSGDIPNALKGHFTTLKVAQQAIDGYMNSLKRGKTNGKTRSASTR